jgi:Rrf2 family protein
MLATRCSMLQPETGNCQLTTVVVCFLRMRISRKAEYALRAILLIAQQPLETVHQIQDLSERGNIPVKFLEQILLTLRNQGILNSKRGVGGGYSLRRRPSELTVLQIIELLDGPIVPLPCGLTNGIDSCGCPDPARCPLHPLAVEARDLVRDLLSSKTIQDLLDESMGHQVLAFEI